MSDETPVTTAPAVIDDTLPGGPRWMHNLGDQPIWVETKSELAKIMAERGLVHAETTTHAKYDQSPWATQTRLRHDAVDPFLPKGEMPWEQPKAPPVPEIPNVESLGLLGPDGRPIGSTVTLDYRTASDLRTYFSWIVRARYEPELFCALCRGEWKTGKAIYDIDEHKIEIKCDCRRIVYAGSTKFTRHPPTLPGPLPDGTVWQGVRQLFLTNDEALTLRGWKAILLRLSLREALRCNLCFEQNQADGARASVTDLHIRIECRCRRYDFAGMTH